MFRNAACLAVSLVWIISPLAADQVIKTGGETQINSFTSFNQGFPAIAVDASGNFFAVWESRFQDGSDFGIFGQLLDAGGTPLGPEMPINTHTTSDQWDPAVAADGQGNFVVAWRSNLQDGNGFGIFAQRFDSAGGPLGGEFQVNSYTMNDQSYAAVAADDSGNFLIVWESRTQDLSLGGVYGQLYDSAGNETGDEFRVNTITAGDQFEPRVAATPGGFLVTWASDNVDGATGKGIAMRQFDSSGIPAGPEQAVNTYTTGDQVSPDVAVASDGSFAVVWENTSPQDGNMDGVFGKVFDSAGLQNGLEFQINTYTTEDQENPRVAADGTGGFVAVWESKGQIDGTNDEDVFGQRFDTAGQLVGGEFQVNTQASYDQDYPNIAGGPNRRFAVVWRSEGGFDGSHFGVFGQRFEVGIFADGFESGDVTAWTSTTP